MGDLKITLESGSSDQKSMTLEPGKALETVTVGRNGGWRVEAPGVSPSHAFFYYDGTTLFVAAADPTNPTLVSGKRATADWMPVVPPADIVLGKAMFRVAADAPVTMNTGLVEIGEGEENATTMFQAAAPEPPPVQKPTPAAGTRPSTRPPRPDISLAPINDESTRFVPIGDPPAPPPSTSLVQTVEAPPPVASPAMMPPMGGGGMPTMGNMPPMGPNGMPSMGQMTKPVPMPGSGGDSPLAKFKADWEKATPPRKAIVALMPLAVIGAIFYCFSTLMGGKAPPPEDDGEEKPAASASASAASTKKSPPPTASNDPGGTTAIPTMPVSPSTAAMASASAASAGGPPPSGTKDSKSSKDAPPPKTTERLAADAFAAGDLPTAARLYDQLARENPNNPAFSEAARICHAKIDAPPE